MVFDVYCANNITGDELLVSAFGTREEAEEYIKISENRYEGLSFWIEESDENS